MKRPTVPLLQNFIPRHLRLGICFKDYKDLPCNDYSNKFVPMAGENGETVVSAGVKKIVDLREYRKKFTRKDFDLQNLLEAGVPLKSIDLPISNKYLSELQNHLNQLSELDNMNKANEKANMEIENFFKPENDN